MNEKTLQKISAELVSELTGQKFGKIFIISRFRLAVDFRLDDSKYLYISIEPTQPRIYLIKRRLPDLEKNTKNPSPFISHLRSKLSNAFLENVEKVADERILKFKFSAKNDVGQIQIYQLIVQLTGRSSNLFLLDANEFILDALRENSGDGQEIADKYQPPTTSSERRETFDVFPQGDFPTLSEALDAHFKEIEAENVFRSKANSAKSKLKKEISKRKRLVKNLQGDLKNHGDAETWKRFGDLLLANVATAQRAGDKISVIDYFDENIPTIEIEVDKNDSITAAAEKFFKKYTKARNAKEEISKRLAEVNAELEKFQLQNEKLDAAITEKDLEFVEQIAGREKKKEKRKGKSGKDFTGAREFTSSDGFEILVGKRSKDNDYLTFRVANSLDLWLHAADYPGSHVIVKNPNRIEIPQKTLLEAAELAAFYSKAKEQTKVAVHYTQKKFVNKPKGAIPGLVSLASFKTILVEPRILESN